MLRLESRSGRLSVLLLILLLAAFVRIWHIDLQSFWIDEGFTYNLTQSADPFKILTKDVHPPLYFLLVTGWAQIVGTSEMALRYSSVLPGMLAVALIYQIAREIERQRGLRSAYVIPVLAALLLSVADSEIYLAQEFRSYTLQLLWISLSMLCFLRWQRTQRHAYYLGWILSTSAIVYTFYLGAWIGVVQGVWALLFLRGRQRWQAIAALFISALLLLPWLLYSLGAQTDNLSYAEWIRPNAFVLDDLRRRYFTGQWGITILLALFGLATLREDGTRWRLIWRPIAPAALLLLWLLLPLLLTFAANGFAPLYTPWRINQIAPAVALLIAFGLGQARPPLRGVLLAGLLLYGLTTVDFWREKQPWRDFTYATAPYFAPDDLLLVEVGGDDYAPVYHYKHQGPPDLTVRGLTTWRRLEPETYEAGLPALIYQRPQLWFLYWGKDESAFAWLNTLGYVRSSTWRTSFNPDVYYYRYDLLPEQPIARYSNGLLLRQATVHTPLHFDLLWSAEAPLDADYTSSAILLNEAGQLVAQRDSLPLLGRSYSSQWQPGELVYDPKLLQTSDGAPLPAGKFQAGIVVYRFTADGIERLLTESGEDLVLLGEIQIDAPYAAPDFPVGREVLIIEPNASE